MTRKEARATTRGLLARAVSECSTIRRKRLLCRMKIGYRLSCFKLFPFLGLDGGVAHATLLNVRHPAIPATGRQGESPVGGMGLGGTDGGGPPSPQWAWRGGKRRES